MKYYCLKTSGNLKQILWLSNNYKSQGTVARHFLRYCGIFNDNLLKIHWWVCFWKNFTISLSTFGEVTSKQAGRLTRSVHLRKDGRTRQSSRVVYAKKHQQIAVTLILSWLRLLLSNWFTPIWTCRLTVPSATDWLCESILLRRFFLCYGSCVYTTVSYLFCGFAR